MYFDIDHFKRINDTLGHAAGDEILKQFAARLLKSVRTVDPLAPLAGDEFVIVLESLRNADVPRMVASKIVTNVGEPMHMAGQDLIVKTGIGAAYGHMKNLTAADLLAMADRSLYTANAAGRNTFEVESH